jgi:hypothetical protein
LNNNITFDLLLPCGTRAYVVCMPDGQCLWCCEANGKALGRGYKPTADEARAMAAQSARQVLRRSQALLDGAR